MHQRGRGRRELHVLPRAEHALDEHLARLARHTLDSALRVLDRERERAARVAPDQRVAVAELFEHLVSHPVLVQSVRQLGGVLRHRSQKRERHAAHRERRVLHTRREHQIDCAAVEHLRCHLVRVVCDPGETPDSGEAGLTVDLLEAITKRRQQQAVDRRLRRLLSPRRRDSQLKESRLDERKRCARVDNVDRLREHLLLRDLLVQRARERPQPAHRQQRTLAHLRRKVTHQRQQVGGERRAALKRLEDFLWAVDLVSAARHPRRPWVLLGHS
mmetsp:Transcript_74501/g.223967  ORF Transcript_74501/g.223967 Transcript_74501/m.223967 type:complete len:273 (+) Transcript_74501:1445-2263(+)